LDICMKPKLQSALRLRPCCYDEQQLCGCITSNSRFIGVCPLFTGQFPIPFSSSQGRGSGWQTSKQAEGRCLAKVE
jgi:hypothetical protein